MYVLAAGSLGPLHTGKKEISSFYFLPPAFVSIPRTTQKFFPLGSLISSQEISTLSPNMQIPVEGTKREPQQNQ